MSGGPVRLDLHVHSSRSVDGRASLRELLERACSLGLQGLALTDHNTVAGHAELAELSLRFPSLVLIAGVEVSTREGHLLLYGITEAPPRGVPLADAVTWAYEQGGAAAVAHPFRWPHGAGHRGRVPGGACAIEATNGHTSWPANRRATAAARGEGRPTTGGSDAHRARDLGRAVTLFPEGTRSAADALVALRRGKVVPEGRSLGPAEWLRWGIDAGFARLRRGLPPV